MRQAIVGLVLAGMLLLGLQPAEAQRQKNPALEDLEVTEHLGEQVPRDLLFVDERGEQVTLGSYLDGDKPVLLSMVYHDCPMLCNITTDELVGTLAEMSWHPGGEFEVLSVSFSHAEGPELAARQKAKYIKELGRPEAAEGWHFLTGSEASIRRLAESIGFVFRWDERTEQYAHPAMFTFLSPDGTITRYIYGLEIEPRTMRTALVEASEGTIGNVLDQAILYCFQYDPDANSYVAQAFQIMKLGGLLTMLILGSVLVFFWRRERRSLDQLAQT